MRCRAEITVFLTLLFGIMSALTITVIESAGNQATRIEVERIMQTAVHSCFSEYNQELLETYDIFAIDSSYRTVKGDTDNIRKHLQRYAEKNIKDEDLVDGDDFLNLSVDETSLRRYEILSDNNGTPLWNQINEYMSNSYMLPYKSTMLSLKKLMEKRDDSDFMSKFSEALENSGDVSNNPAEKIYDIATTTNLIEYLFDEKQDFKSVPRNCPSKRTLKKGTYTRPLQADMDGEYRLNAYININFSDSVNIVDYCYMGAEEEYIISGMTKESDCIRECAGWILAQREAKNLEAMMQNEDVLRETEDMSFKLCEDGGNQYDVQLSLIYAWTFIESLIEVRGLYEDGCVDISSGIQSPTVPLDEIEEFEDYLGECSAFGMDYRSILMGMLMNIDSITKLKRCMDIIELNMIHNGYEGFKIDGCVTYFMARMILNSKYGYVTEIEREFGY